MIDILYIAKGRPEFTEASLAALLANTDWTKARLVIYTDGARFERPAVSVRVNEAVHGGPVAIMKDFMSWPGSQTFAKIDNDVIVPPGWLDRCAAVMDAHTELDLLGIEPPSTTIRVNLGGSKDYAPCDAIGGVGLMRRSAFAGSAMKPHSIYGGFTEWQLAHPEVKKGWIAPPLNLFLLDRLTMEPWASLSRRYIAEGQQRLWKNYSAEDSYLWQWWLDKQAA